jgi:hypothetical protein
MTTKKDKAPRRQYRTTDGKRLPGVTTVLGVLDKPALMGWAASVAAEATAHACANGEPPHQAAITGRAAVFTRRDKAADLGTRAHALVEAHFSGEAVVVDVSDPEVAKVAECAQRAIAHIKATCDRVVAVEVAHSVDSVPWKTMDLGGYGGTLDMIVERGGRQYVADLKTGKGAYDEVVPQLAAYRHLWEQQHSAECMIDGGIVFHVPVDGEGVNEHQIDSATLDAGWRVFCGALIVYHARDAAKLKKGEA